MDKKIYTKLTSYLCDIDSLINVTCDSCEQNMYTNQLGALEVAKKYFTEVFELLSQINPN